MARGGRRRLAAAQASLVTCEPAANLYSRGKYGNKAPWFDPACKIAMSWRRGHGGVEEYVSKDKIPTPWKTIIVRLRSAQGMSHVELPEAHV